MPHRVRSSRGLSRRDFDDVLRLRDACESTQRVDLKLEPISEHRAGPPDTAVIRANGNLIGYCGVSLGFDAEVCGMVHPLHRGRGVGTALLGAASEMAAKARRDSILVICEEAAPVALDWMRRRGATLHQTELRMVLRTADRVRSEAPSVGLREATAADLDLVARILSDGFAQPLDTFSRERMQDALQGETLLAYAGDRLVGTTRLVRGARRWMIYGFVVDRGLRGQGFGHSMLDATLDIAAHRGIIEVGLEVDPDNAAAVRLYASAGFRAVTTYRYMRLAIDRRM